MNSQEWKRLAQQIRLARKARKWTQQELADAANVSLGTVQNAEAGKSVPQPGNRIAILGALSITEEGKPVTPEAWSPEVKVTLNLVGLWLEQVQGEERAARIDRIVMGVLSPE